MSVRQLTLRNKMICFLKWNVHRKANNVIREYIMKFNMVLSLALAAQAPK